MAIRHLHDVPTPALILNRRQVQTNIRAMAERVKSQGLKLRPHTKTHKSRLIGRWQVEAGATGLTVAKVGELEIMAEVCSDLMLAYPALDPQRTGRVAAVAKDHTVRVAADTRLALERLAQAAQAAGSTIGILPDIDLGLRRTGVQTPQQALELAQFADRTPGLRLDGLFCYHGHIHDTDTDTMARRMDQAEARVAETLDLWQRHGLSAAIVSGGSTPTSGQAGHLKHCTEIRPGTYVFNDGDTLEGNWVTVDQCAAWIVATVISDAVPGHCVVDAGSKTLTSDRLFLHEDQPRFGALLDHPGAVIVRLNEEHGVVDLSRCPRPPKLGQRVRILMNHVCPCVNLQDQAWLLDDDGSVEPLPIDARGRLS